MDSYYDCIDFSISYVAFLMETERIIYLFFLKGGVIDLMILRLKMTVN